MYLRPGMPLAGKLEGVAKFRGRGRGTGGEKKKFEVNVWVLDFWEEGKGKGDKECTLFGAKFVKGNTPFIVTRAVLLQQSRGRFAWPRSTRCTLFSKSQENWAGGSDIPNIGKSEAQLIIAVVRFFLTHYWNKNTKVLTMYSVIFSQLHNVDISTISTGYNAYYWLKSSQFVTSKTFLLALWDLKPKWACILCFIIRDMKKIFVGLGKKFMWFCSNLALSKMGEALKKLKVFSLIVWVPVAGQLGRPSEVQSVKLSFFNQPSKPSHIGVGALKPIQIDTIMHGASPNQWTTAWTAKSIAFKFSTHFPQSTLHRAIRLTGHTCHSVSLNNCANFDEIV